MEMAQATHEHCVSVVLQCYLPAALQKMTLEQEAAAMASDKHSCPASFKAPSKSLLAEGGALVQPGITTAQRKAPPVSPHN